MQQEAITLVAALKTNSSDGESLLARVKSIAATDSDDRGPKHFLSAMNERLEPNARRHHVRVVIYIDEAYSLSRAFAPNDPKRSFYDTFLSAFTDLGPEQDIFLISLSTHSHMAELARPQHEQRSARSSESPSYHQAPYTELVFDCLPDNKPIFNPTMMAMTLGDVAELSFLVKFGRPLYVRLNMRCDHF